MKAIFMGALVLASAAAAGPARADKSAYCEAYARDFADRVTQDKTIWQHKFSIAKDACMGGSPQQAGKITQPDAPAAQEADKPAPDAVAVPKPKPKPKAVAAKVGKPAEPDTAQADAGASSKVKLKPGSAAWKDYCGGKYNSFDPATGMYLANSGVKKPCKVTTTESGDLNTSQ